MKNQVRRQSFNHNTLCAHAMPQPPLLLTHQYQQVDHQAFHSCRQSWPIVPHGGFQQHVPCVQLPLGSFFFRCQLRSTSQSIFRSFCYLGHLHRCTEEIQHYRRGFGWIQLQFELQPINDLVCDAIENDMEEERRNKEF